MSVIGIRRRNRRIPWNSSDKSNCQERSLSTWLKDAAEPPASNQRLVAQRIDQYVRSHPGLPGVVTVIAGEAAVTLLMSR
jgi:hypothetical protein